MLLVRLFLFIIPPVWAAMRVKSTKREKMSRRFWILGPELALFCVIADVLIGLFLGDALTFGGPAGPPDIVRFSATGADHLAISDFIVSNLIGLRRVHAVLHAWRDLHAPGKRRLHALHDASRQWPRDPLASYASMHSRREVVSYLALRVSSCAARLVKFGLHANSAQNIRRRSHRWR